MSSVTCFVGLDYHQDSVQVCVLDAGGRQLLNRSCSNHWKEVAAAVGSVGGVVKRAAIEACCGAADLAEELVERVGWSIDLAHPQYVARMKRSPDKSDYCDGRMLADLTRVGYLPKVHLASSYERDLRQLVNHRQALVDQRRASKLRVGAVLREQRAKPSFECSRCACSRWTKPWMAWARGAEQLSDQGRWIVNDLLDELAHLDRKVIAAEARLRQATANDPMIDRLMNEPGIGEVTAWVLRAYVGRFDRFNSGRQLSRYCGLSPCNASSGARQADAGLVKGCNKLLRATLIQAAHRLINTQPRWRGLSDSMRRRGKPASVIVAAVANRWARGLWHRMLPVQSEVQAGAPPQAGALPQTPPHFAPPPRRLSE